jgi:hypothetical protein
MYMADVAAMAFAIQGFGQADPPHHVCKLTQIGTFGGPDGNCSTGPVDFILDYLNSKAISLEFMQGLRHLVECKTENEDMAIPRSGSARTM